MLSVLEIRFCVQGRFAGVGQAKSLRRAKSAYQPRSSQRLASDCFRSMAQAQAGDARIIPSSIFSVRDVIVSVAVRSPSAVTPNALGFALAVADAVPLEPLPTSATAENDFGPATILACFTKCVAEAISVQTPITTVEHSQPSCQYSPLRYHRVE